MPSVCDDPGHVGFDSGNVNFGVQEKSVTLPTAHFFREALERSGIHVVMTRTEDVKLPLDNVNQDLSDRAQIANSNKVDLFVSWHTDSFPGNPDAKGVAAWVFTGAAGKGTEKIAQRIVDSIAAATGQVNRGVKFADYAVLVGTNMPAVLIEAGFASNSDEGKKLTDPAFQRIQAEAAAKAVCEFLNVTYVPFKEPVPAGTKILSAPSATIEQAQAWARSKNAPQAFVDLAPLYWKLAPERGVDPVIGYVQFGHETGFLYRDGKSSAGIDASYHNPCGLKVTTGGGDQDPNAHKRFATWEEGITAHLDHAALYAGAPGYPKADSPDPRHFPYLLGKAKTVEELGGKWAPNPEYGKKLVAYAEELRNTKPPETDWNGHEFEKQIQRVIDAGILKGYDETHFGPDDTLTRGQAAAMMCRLIDHLKNEEGR